jgi:CubicO group peptidase (beta-lactamase class C family)
LKLDDPAIKYLPELKAVHNPFGDMGDITIRQLLNHTAGFRNSTFPYKNGKDWQPFEPRKYSQVEAMLPFTEILFKPAVNTAIQISASFSRANYRASNRRRL